MTDIPPAYPPAAPPPPVPPRRSNARLVVYGLAVGAAFVGVGVLIGLASSQSPSDRPKQTAPASVRKATPAKEPKDAEPVYATVDADSFSMDLRTTERQCFGSAGCLVTVEPDVTYLGLSDSIDPNAVYEISYEITGDESGPVVDTMELTDQTKLSYTPSRISTPSSGTKVTVEIMDVIAR